MSIYTCKKQLPVSKTQNLRVYIRGL